MYLLTGVSKDTGRTWYKLLVIQKDKDNNVVARAETFISEKVYNALKSCGIKAYQTFVEVK